MNVVIVQLINFAYISLIMSQFDYIKNIAKYGLENDQERLLASLNEFIDYSKKTKKINFALQLQSLVKNSSPRQTSNSLTKVGSDAYFNKIEDREIRELILEKITSDYRFENLVATEPTLNELRLFIKEQNSFDLLKRFDLPVANKILFHGPSGCGKTLASYVLAGELNRVMLVVNLGAVVSSKLGETSKNLARIFKRASEDDCILFIDEFDSLGKVREYSQDHGEMNRIVNTLLQLFDYLPQRSILIAATNQKDMLDEAIVRRFDMNLEFNLPTEALIKKLIAITLRNGKFIFDKQVAQNTIVQLAKGLSYFGIQKTLVMTIKRSLFCSDGQSTPLKATINTKLWKELIIAEKYSLNAK
jgi:AAA+ superfamily predicted ATPase